jgi:hypothetical protein
VLAALDAAPTSVELLLEYSHYLGQSRKTLERVSTSGLIFRNFILE